MEKELITKLHKNFEDCAHEKDGVEFWYARDLMGLLGYNKWENFEKVIQKAMTACSGAKQSPADHFPDVRKMVDIGSGSQKSIIDFMLTRYACYLIAQNGDPHFVIPAKAGIYASILKFQQCLLKKVTSSTFSPITERQLFTLA